MFHKSAGRGAWRATTWAAAARRHRDEVERGHGAGQAGQHHAAHQASERGVRVEEGRRWAAQALLQRLPAAVLHPDDGRDRKHQAAGRRRDGDAWGQREPGSRADRAGGVGAGLPFAIREGGLTVGAGVITKIIE
jgi:hypothetical protein